MVRARPHDPTPLSLVSLSGSDANRGRGGCAGIANSSSEAPTEARKTGRFAPQSIWPHRTPAPRHDCALWPGVVRWSGDGEAPSGAWRVELRTARCGARQESVRRFWGQVRGIGAWRAIPEIGGPVRWSAVPPDSDNGGQSVRLITGL